MISFFISFFLKKHNFIFYNFFLKKHTFFFTFSSFHFPFPSNISLQHFPPTFPSYIFLSHTTFSPNLPLPLLIESNPVATLPVFLFLFSQLTIQTSPLPSPFSSSFSCHPPFEGHCYLLPFERC